MNYNYFINEIENLKSKNNLRLLKDIEHDGTFIVEEGRKILNLSSNDYLGIVTNSNLQEEYLNSGVSRILGSSSSRLLTGNHKEYRELEQLLSDSYERESALVFSSGYHANIGILPALTGKGDLILADKLVHASLIDGIRLSGAQVIRYKHNDYKHLEKLLERNSLHTRNIFIVTESIFSMDGDLADLNKLVELKNCYKTFLYVDEAHAVGVRGKKGLGLVEELDLIKDVDFIVGTFGKALASQGAWIVCNSQFRDFLINRMRSLIFTTALPPIIVGWNRFVFEKMMGMKDKRDALQVVSDEMAHSFELKGYQTQVASHIVPLIVYENIKSVQLSNHFLKKGYYVLPVRPPTVPEGTARLRFSLTAAITRQDVKNIIDVLPFNKAL